MICLWAKKYNTNTGATAISEAAKAFNDESFQRIGFPSGNAEDWRALPEIESVRSFAKYALMKILGWQRETCRRFGLRFETWYFESELHETKRVERALEKLKKMDATFEDDGAVWFRATTFHSQVPAVSNGPATASHLSLPELFCMAMGALHSVSPGRRSHTSALTPAGSVMGSAYRVIW